MTTVINIKYNSVPRLEIAAHLGMITSFSYIAQAKFAYGTPIKGILRGVSSVVIQPVVESLRVRVLPADGFMAIVEHHRNARNQTTGLADSLFACA